MSPVTIKEKISSLPDFSSPKGAYEALKPLFPPVTSQSRLRKKGRIKFTQTPTGRVFYSKSDLHSFFRYDESFLDPPIQQEDEAQLLFEFMHDPPFNAPKEQKN